MGNESRRCLQCGYEGEMQTWLLNYSLPQFILIVLLLSCVIPGIIFLMWGWGKFKCPDCGALGKNATRSAGTMRKNALERRTRKCPFCAEDIKDEAKVCRYCGKDVRDGMTRSEMYNLAYKKHFMEGDTGTADDLYREIFERFPDTKEAKAAKNQLDSINR